MFSMEAPKFLILIELSHLRATLRGARRRHNTMTASELGFTLAVIIFTTYRIRQAAGRSLRLAARYP